ncbi:MAG: hypothetical protein ACT4QE_10080 [Anaerolineales bacterium]
MSRMTLFAVLLLFLSAVVAVTPPGLCSCWLIADVEQVHAHPAGDEDHPHSHDYLFELFNTHLPATPPSVAAAAAVIAQLIGAALRLVLPRQVALGAARWSGSVELPPPRLVA